ncbi:MAG: Ribosomal RNA small subunit methyltransferase I [Elusimicrobia bacterium]|nr:Ribosomal RNA small subunit methyltransferase I [Elusimicrobiota bacterium]
MSSTGILYILATPIGNLGDITLRAIETLKNVDVVACEDTRRTEKLLSHLGFRKSLHRYDEHTHAPSSQKIIEWLKMGRSVALVTDAGTPAISDPGSRLVAEVLENQLKVVPIPGASSVSAALSVSGFVGEGYVFLGFLPRKKGPATRLLQASLGLGKNLVLFESPFRVADTLQLIHDVAPQTQVMLAREITKLHEEFLRGNETEVLEQLKSRPNKGEVVVVIRREKV